MPPVPARARISLRLPSLWAARQAPAAGVRFRGQTNGAGRFHPPPLRPAGERGCGASRGHHSRLSPLSIARAASGAAMGPDPETGRRAPS